MQINGVTTSQPQTLVLIRNAVNAILDVQIVVQGARQPQSVTELQISLSVKLKETASLSISTTWQKHFTFDLSAYLKRTDKNDRRQTWPGR